MKNLCLSHDVHYAMYTEVSRMAPVPRTTATREHTHGPMTMGGFVMRAQGGGVC